MQNISQYNEEWSCGNPLWRIAVVFILLLIFSAVANLSCAQSVTVGEFGDTLHQRYIRVGAYDDNYMLPDAPGDSGQYLMQGANGQWYYATITDATGGGITADSLQNTAWDMNGKLNIYDGGYVIADSGFYDYMYSDLYGQYVITDSIYSDYTMSSAHYTYMFALDDSTLITSKSGDTIATSEWVRAQGYGAGAGGDYLPANYDSGADIYTITVTSDFMGKNRHYSINVDSLIVGTIDDESYYVLPHERGVEGQVLRMGRDSLAEWSDVGNVLPSIQIYGLGAPYFDTVATMGEYQQIAVKNLTDSISSGYSFSDSIITVGASGAGTCLVNMNASIDGPFSSEVSMTVVQNTFEIDMLKSTVVMDTATTVAMTGIIRVENNDELKITVQTPGQPMGTNIRIRNLNFNMTKID